MKQDRREKKEIRAILLGRTAFAADGRLTSPEPGTFVVPQGVVNGAEAVRFLGIKGRSRYYETGLEEEELLAEADNAMRNIGRALYLREQPKAVACLLRYLLTRPAVLVFRYQEGQPVLTVWTGRGLMGWVSRSRAVSAFEREMPESIRPAAAVKAEKKKRAEPSAEDPAPEDYAEEAAPGNREEEPETTEPETTEQEDREA